MTHHCKFVLALCKRVLAREYSLAKSASTEAAAADEVKTGESPAHSRGRCEQQRSIQMRNLKKAVMKFIREEEGLTVVEYAVAGGLISLLVVGAFRALGLTVSGIITEIDAALNA